MSSKAISYGTKKSTGHGKYKPRETNPAGDLSGPENVYVNNQPVVFGASSDGAIDGSKWKPHGEPPGDNHARQKPIPDEIDNQRTSHREGATVFVNGKPISRIGDDVESSKADGIAGGSENVFAGDETGVDLDIPSVAAVVEGDDADVEEPGSGYAYIQSQIDAGRLSTDDIKKQALLNKTAEDNSPAKPPGPLSSSCADIASITPFPTGDAIDSIVLSPNYTVGKLTRKPNVTFDHPVRAGQSGLSVEEICCNLKLLAVNCIEPIRAQYATAFVTNTFRIANGGKSQHHKGQAADIQFRGMSKAQYYTIAQWIRDNVSYDQLLLEYKTTGTGLPWIHISFNKDTQRKQVLTLLNDRTYGQGLIQLA
jgi:hypothetical protein